jgi:chromosome segregation ATPase
MGNGFRRMLSAAGNSSGPPQEYIPKRREPKMEKSDSPAYVPSTPAVSRASDHYAQAQEMFRQLETDLLAQRDENAAMRANYESQLSEMRGKLSYLQMQVSQLVTDKEILTLHRDDAQRELADLDARLDAVAGQMVDIMSKRKRARDDRASDAGQAAVADALEPPQPNAGT